jgi:uncharacterized protein YciI
VTMDGGKLQFLYVLRPVPRLGDEDAWTERDERIVEEHFAQLERLLVEGRLVLAGRTLTIGPSAMGLVILEAGSEEEARELMESDATVREGIMTAELFPYRVGLIRSRSD